MILFYLTRYSISIELRDINSAVTQCIQLKSIQVLSELL
jgi:hypothetical protein